MDWTDNNNDREKKDGGVSLSDWEQASKWFDERSRQLARGEIPEISAEKQRMSAEGYKPLQEDRLPIRPREKKKKNASIRPFRSSQSHEDEKKSGASQRKHTQSQQRRPAETQRRSPVEQRAAGTQRRAEQRPQSATSRQNQPQRKRPDTRRPNEPLSADDRRRIHAGAEKKKKKYKTGVGIAVAVAMAFAAGILLSLFVLFGIENIEVSGDTRYTKEEIIAASGIEIGENIFRVDRKKADEMVCTTLSYIGNLKVSIKGPTTLMLTVTESAEKYALPYSKNFVLLDENYKVLSRIAKTVPKGTVKLVGVKFAQADVGNTIVLTEDSESKLKLADDMLYKANKYEISPVGILGLESVGTLYMIYDNRLKLYFGSEANLDTKMEIGAGLIAQLNEENAAYTGIVMLSTQDKVYFKPGSINAPISSAQEYEMSIAKAKAAAKKAKEAKAAATANTSTASATKASQ